MDSSTVLHCIEEKPDRVTPTELSMTYTTTSTTTDENIELLPETISENKDYLSEDDSEDSLPSKWATCRYSREERSRRKREKLHDNQTQLTNFYPVLQKIRSVIDANMIGNPGIVDNVKRYNK